MGVPEKVVEKTNNEMRFSTLRLTPKDEWTYDVEKTAFLPKERSLSKNTPILAEFWRLGSFLYLSSASGSVALTEKWNTGIVLLGSPGIVSLYDLFSQYTVFDSLWDFRIDQITNGSFYVGREEDKVVVYAIDGVVRLTFLYEKQEMTSMILFPGSYIRFDPTRNRSLKNADLFRTILSLKEEENEVFEFVNPRVNRGDEEDTFLNYRLPADSKVLFRALSALFRKKVENIDIQKRYALTNPYYGDETQSSLLINPSKRDHTRLLELSSLLAKAVDPTGASTDLVKKIGRAYNDTKDLKLTTSSAKSLVEQFLLDGRFALYWGVANSKYQETYESIAEIIWIRQTSDKYKLFQTLSDIYSRNLFTQKRSANRIKIDTYAPTSTELEKTIYNADGSCKDDCAIDKKDYFDIAIYAYNILKKTEDRSMIPRNTLEDNATYKYLSVFFRAARVYIESIDDAAKKQQTVMSFSRQFYDSLLVHLSHSFYSQYTVDEDGAIYISPEFRDGVKIKMPEDFVSNVSTLANIIDILKPSIDELWSGSGKTDDDTYSRIQKEIVRIKGFAALIQEDDYKDYVKTPYKVDKNEKTLLPLVDTESGSLVRYEASIIEEVKNTKTLMTDPRIAELQNVWTKADASTWSLEKEYLRMTQAPYLISRWAQKTSEIKVSALYKDDLLSDIIINYGDYMIEVSGNPMSLKEYYVFAGNLRYYLDRIDETLQGEAMASAIRVFPDKKRINIWDGLYTVDIPK